MPLKPDRPPVPSFHEEVERANQEEELRLKGEELVDVLGLADAIMAGKRAANPGANFDPKPIHTSFKAEIEKKDNG